MKNLYIIAAFCAIGVGYKYYQEPELTPVAKLEQSVNSMDTVINTSVTALRQQSRLVVLESNINSTSTTNVKDYGMEGTRTDIRNMVAEWSVDFSKIRRNNFSIKGDTLTLTISKDMIISQDKNQKDKTYNNNSWLFTFNEDYNMMLQLANEKKMTDDISKQKKSLEATAISSAKIAIKDIISVCVSGLSKPIMIEIIVK